MPRQEGSWKSCPKCGVRLKHLERHMRKAHAREASYPFTGRIKQLKRIKAGRKADAAPKNRVGPVFVSCEYCSVSIAARLYRDHVQRRHPGKRANWRPPLAEKIREQGLDSKVRESLGKLKFPRYEQRYREWFREVQGGAPGTGRHGR